jgi:O-methyltransferase involved in polyketide biosynthesis
MIPERASRTALMVAYMRAVADVGATHVRDFRDPTARVFLNDMWLNRLTKIEAEVRDSRNSMTLGFARVSADLMALRTSTIDAAVRSAVTRGTTQVVVLVRGECPSSKVLAFSR